MCLSFCCQIFNCEIPFKNANNNMSSYYRMMCKFFDLICIFQCISLFSANKVEKSFPIILKIQILCILNFS